VFEGQKLSGPSSFGYCLFELRVHREEFSRLGSFLLLFCWHKKEGVTALRAGTKEALTDYSVIKQIKKTDCSVFLQEQ
jgi:hypothetical protein